MIVIDASALLEVLLRSMSGLAVEALLKDTMAPDLLDAEVFHRLVRAQQGGTLTPTQLDERLALLYDAPIERVPCRELLHTARRFVTAMSGYDALYAALAASLRCPLVTTDGRLARTATTQFGLIVTHVPTSGR
ncbi:MAG: type II toxin-antitoxin system VapC family toxin [Pseudonocardiaceae bacterium]